MPGDLKSWTVARVNESLPSVNRSKFLKKEAFDEQHPKLMPFRMGLQVPHSLDPKMSPEGAIWTSPSAPWRSDM